MSTKRSELRLGEVLRKAETWIELSPEETYKEVTVRLWGRGVVLRREVSGSEIGTTRRLQVRRRQFIFSRIDARNGAFGLIPPELDGAVVSNEFPVFDVDGSRLLPEFLGWLSRTAGFVETCKAASEGSTNRVRLKEDRFLRLPIALPDVVEQSRIVTRIDRVVAKLEEAEHLIASANADGADLMRGAFRLVAADAPSRPMRDVAPIVRREVAIKADSEYPELGIRSFGKGTFHKPAIQGIAIGQKRLFMIEPRDLLFNNVFAWEGAVAVAQDRDAGRFGSHRFMTCVPRGELATADFLRYFFLTETGLGLLGTASPGGAGRNRTLGVEALAAIPVPVPPIARQRWFDRLQALASEAAAHRVEESVHLAAVVPSLLVQVFGGER
ncbi:MAG: restriction endonuclease subunit S [Deltaproteobacteria bacterium]|nr:restriction endonuclease subunit S [Deltaproteobacteria bacterium]